MSDPINLISDIFAMSEPINLISDTESESDSDGGMQLDDQVRADGIPMHDSGEGLELRNVDGIPMSRSGSSDDAWGVNINMSGSDTGMSSTSHLISIYLPEPSEL